MSDGWR